MAKSAIAAPDISIVRGNQSVENLRLNITPLTVVSTGTITAIPAIDLYVQVTWDGSTTGVLVGQMVKITNSTTVRTWGVIRKAPVSTTLYINEVPLGSPGYTTDIESPIQVGDTVTIYSHHPMWGLHSRINNRIFYQEWDVAYISQNEDIPPVANAGQWQSAKVSIGSTAAFTLPRFGTNTSFAMSGTVSSHLWTLPTGVTLQAGYATSDSVIAVDAEAGYHLIAYRVTDSNGKTHTAYTWLFVSDGTTGTTLDERYPLSNLTLQQTQKGFTGSFTMTGTSLESVLYPGAGILINETPHFANGTLTDGVFVDCFIGYIADVDYSYDANRVATASVSFESPIIYANRIVQPEQSLTEKANAANWTQCSSAMSNPRGAFYFAWKHKTPALGDMHDIDANNLTTPRRKTIEYNSKTLGQALDVAAKLFLVNIGSAADGTSVIRNYPQYMNNTDRNALAVRMTWTAQDFSLSSGLKYRKNMLSKVAVSTTGAFAYNGTTTKAWLGGKKWNQGASSSELPNFTVPMTNGLARVLEVVGHYHAEQNRDITEIPFTLLANQDVIDPAYLIWDRLTIAATYDPRGTGWSNNRMLATRVDRSWTKGANGYDKTITIGLQPETFGQPGKEIPIGNVNVSAANRPAIAFAPTVVLGGLGVMLAVNATGKLAVTYDYLADSPQWIDITGRFEGDVCDFDWDYASAYFAGGNNITQALSVYVCTIDPTTFRVYRINDIKSPAFVADEIASASLNDSSPDYNGRIRCSKQTPTLVLAAWKDQTGVEFIRSTDGGVVWSSKANVGSAVTDTANDDAHFGMDIYNVTQVISAPDATPEYGLYIATTASGSFSAVTSTNRSSIVQPLIKLKSETIAYVTDLTATTPDTNITFDAGTDTNYTLDTGSGMTSGEETTGGNPDNCYKGLSGAFGINQTIQIKIDLGGSVEIDDVLFDAYVDAPGGTDGDNRVLGRLAAVSVFNNDGSIADPVNNATWQSFVCSVDDPSWSPPYTCDEIWIRLKGAGSYSSSDVRLDNIIISVVGEGANASKLYKVTSLTGTSLWTDVSPVADVAPVRPHDLSIDLIDTDVMHTVADNDVWYSSANGGTVWSSEETSSDKRVPYSVGDALVFGGVTDVEIALDGATFDSKVGNLAAAWETIGTIKRILIL